MHSSFKYEQIDIAKSGNKVGSVQLQYRGNVPSAYTHDETVPFSVGMYMQNGEKEGIVASAIAFAKSYTLGLPQPFLANVPLTKLSPGYDGWVFTMHSDEIKKLEANLSPNNVVMEKTFLGGTGPNAIDVTGYTLIQVGWEAAMGQCMGCTCGGKTQKPVDAVVRDEASEIFKKGFEWGNPTWMLRFYLKDPEKEILNSKTARVHGDFKDYYQTEPMEQVRLACVNYRLCKFPADCAVKKSVCCSCPLYARAQHTARVLPHSPDAQKVPPQVVMGIGSTMKGSMPPPPPHVIG